MKGSKIKLFGLCLIGILSLTGCESSGKKLTVVASTQSIESRDLGKSGPIYYTTRYYNAASELATKLILNPLSQALAHKGYQPEAIDTPVDVVVWIAAIENQVYISRQASQAGPPMSGNKDSVRHQNVAGLMGRYRQLAFDSPNNPGSFVITPDGDVVGTGNLGHDPAGDIDQPSAGARMSAAFQRSVLAVWATPTRAPTQKENDEIWRVEIVSEVPAKSAPPTMAQLIQAAADHVLENSGGPKKITAPASADSE